MAQPLRGLVVLPLLLNAIGCCTRINVRTARPTGPTDSITHNKVVVKAATLPSGNPSTVRVTDYYPPGGGDGVNEIVIDWSQTNQGAAEYASINFPSGSFGDGPRKVEVTAMHYNACRLEAYDRNGNAVDTADHTAGQRTLQKLTLSGGNISRIDIVGAEIGLTEICYKR